MNLPMPPGDKQLPVLWTDEVAQSEGQLDLRRAAMIAGGLFLALLLLSALVPIGAAVIGGGQVGVESRVKKIAHPTGGVISEILVTNGEHVEKGQLLLRLDDQVSGADASYSNLTVEQLLAQRARLEAERLGLRAIIFPPELLNARTDSARTAMADESHLFSIRRGEEGQMRAQLGERVQQFNETIRGLEAQIASLRQQRALIEPERANVRELWDKQLVTISRLNQLERTAADLDGNIASLRAQIAQTRARISETQEQMLTLDATRRAESGTELSRVNTTLNEQQTRRVAAADQQNRREIRAPYSGTIEKIAFAAIGEVIRPAEPIMEIVPDRDVMVVEAAISPSDIDQVKVGQAARVRFAAFNRSATPEIPGKVTYVATDRSENPEAHQSYYLARIAVDQAVLRREGLQLRSGMPTETYIETGSRSLLSYATKPLRDQIARSFKDN